MSRIRLQKELQGLTHVSAVEQNQVIIHKICKIHCITEVQGDLGCKIFFQRLQQSLQTGEAKNPSKNALKTKAHILLVKFFSTALLELPLSLGKRNHLQMFKVGRSLACFHASLTLQRFQLTFFNVIQNEQT